MSTNCGCEPKKYNLSMGCCVPVVAPADQYYTKYQTDKKIEEAISGITGTTGCCITPEEVDEKIEEAISGITVSGVTEEQMNQAITSAMTIVEGEIPSLDGYATEQWVLNKHYITGVDLSDYATKEEIPVVPTSNTAFTNDAGYLTDADFPDLTGYATKEWVINQNYVVNSELIQYVSNLQNQIDSLKQQISGCCGDTGETLTRWITMTGENDYTCSGTTKMTKEKEQQSTDGGNTWTDTGNYRTGSTVLEVNSVDCGYLAPLKFRGILIDNYSTSEPIEVQCNTSTTLSKEEVHTTIQYKSIEIGDCVTTVGEKAFLNEIYVTGLTIPSGVTTIERMAFDKVGGSESVTSFTLTLNEGLITIGDFGFAACKNLTSVTIPNTVTSIGNGAFESCDKLTTIVIGSGVTNIGNAAFGKSTGATPTDSITILATTPPTIAPNTFDTGNDCPLLVPSASVNAYKSAWSAYASRIQAIP